MPPDVGVGELGDAPLLLVADRLRRMPVGGVAAGSDLDKHHRAVVEHDQIDVSAEHGFPSGDDPVADAAQIFGRLVFSTTAEFVA